MFLNNIGYIKQQNIKTGSTNSYSKSRKKYVLIFFKSLKTILRMTALSHPQDFKFKFQKFKIF